MRNSYNLAEKFLGSIGKRINTTYSPQFGTIPPLKDGWQMAKDLVVRSAFYNLEAKVHFASYNNDMVVFSHAFDAPTLVKPEIIEATFLHLQIALLLACESGMLTPEALSSMRLVPAIPGLKLQPNFPLAFAALRYAIDHPEDEEFLPF
jgi:hypothetical protein